MKITIEYENLRERDTALKLIKKLTSSTPPEIVLKYIGAYGGLD